MIVIGRDSLVRPFYVIGRLLVPIVDRGSFVGLVGKKPLAFCWAILNWCGIVLSSTPKKYYASCPVVVPSLFKKRLKRHTLD